MATIDEYLRPGDLLAMEYQITGGNETLIALAVHSVKQSVASNPMVDYQSGKREYRTDLETGIVYEYLVIKVICRKTAKGSRNEIQQAAIGGIVAMAAAAVVAYSAAVVYRSYVKLETTRIVERIAIDPDASDVVKVAAIEAVGGQTQSLGDGVASAGASLAIGGLILAGIYLASKHT